MSRLFDSISTLISLFHEHASEDGDSSVLSRREMKEFILKEFADVIANPRDSQTIDKILHFLEWDGDGKIDFNEFLFLVFRVAKACYWYLQKGPCLLQRTKLITSGKSLREPEINNKGHQRQLQEEEPQIGDSNRHRSCEPQPQRDTRVHKLETLQETESHHQQRNTQDRDDAKRTSRSEDPISRVYEERSQEPSNQSNILQPPELDGQEDVQSHSESRKPKPLVEERGSRQTRQSERKGDVRTHSTPHESESQPNERGSLQARRPEPRADDRQNQEGPRPDQMADVKSHNQPRKPQPLRNQRSSCEPQEPAPQMNDEENHHPQDQEAVQEAAGGSDIQPQRTGLLTNGTSGYHRRELEAEEIDGNRRQTREQKGVQRKEVKRLYQSYIKEPLVVERSCYERHEPGRRVYEEITHSSETKAENLDRQRRRIQAQLRDERDEERRKREPYTNEKRREHFQDEEINLEGRIRKGREWEEPAQERRIVRSRDVEAAVVEITGRETREKEERGPIDTYERTRRTTEVAAEADVRVRRVTEAAEPRGDRVRREQDCDIGEVEGRIRQGREREEPAQERRIIRSLDVEAEVSESTRRETREREERRPIDTYERTRRDVEVAAEADVRVRRVTKEPEPRGDGRRRERDCDIVEDDERRIRQGREREEPTQERRIIRSRDLEAEVSESIRRETREREERGPIDTYERTRRTTEVAAEADVRVQRVTKEPESRGDRVRRERDCDIVEDDERRIRQGREREEPAQERRIIRSRDLEAEVSESVQRETRERQERRPIDTYERTRRDVEVAAEADVRVQRVTKEPEPRGDGRRRERDCDIVEDDERRIRQGREREEPAQERRIIRSRDVEAEVSESIRRETREREERGPIDTYERTRRTIEVAAEADVRVRRITEEPEARGEAARRVCSHDSEPAKPCDIENRSVVQEQETVVTDASREGEGSSNKSFYQTVVLDTKDLSLPGDLDTVSDLRVSYLPNEADVRPDVKVLPPACEPHTAAYLIHVIRSLDDPQAVTYKVVCPQQHRSAQPVYVTKCYASPQPPATPCEGSNRQEPERGEDNSKAGEPGELEATQRTGPCVPEAQPGRGGNQQPAESSPEDREDLKERPEVQDKEGPCEQERAETEAKGEGQEEAPSESVKDEPAPPQSEAGDTRTNEQCPRAPEPNTEPQENGSKEGVPRAAESECRPAAGDEGNQAQPQEGESPQREDGQQQNQCAEGKVKAPERSPEDGDPGKAPEAPESGGRKAPARKTGRRAAEEPNPQPREAPRCPTKAEAP